MSLIRSTFEGVAERYLGDTLNAYDFYLTPQTPPDVADYAPSALFESEVQKFKRHFPVARLDLHSVDAVTLRITLGRALVAQLESRTLAEIELSGETGDVEPVILEEAFAELRVRLLRAFTSSPELS